jgi:hypothetical protein
VAAFAVGVALFTVLLLPPLELIAGLDAPPPTLETAGDGAVLAAVPALGLGDELEQAAAHRTNQERAETV